MPDGTHVTYPLIAEPSSVVASFVPLLIAWLWFAPPVPPSSLESCCVLLDVSPVALEVCPPPEEVVEPPPEEVVEPPPELVVCPPPLDVV